jgi:hypothetical protein
MLWDVESGWEGSLLYRRARQTISVMVKQVCRVLACSLGIHCIYVSQGFLLLPENPLNTIASHHILLTLVDVQEM